MEFWKAFLELVDSEFFAEEVDWEGSYAKLVKDFEDNRRNG